MKRLGVLALLFWVPMTWGQTAIVFPPEPRVLRFSCTDIAAQAMYMLPGPSSIGSNCLTETGNGDLTTGAPYLLATPARLQNLRCIHVAPSAAATWTFTVVVNGVDTGITCASTEPATACSDIEHVAHVARGLPAAVRINDSAASDGTGAIRCTLEAVRE